MYLHRSVPALSAENPNRDTDAMSCSILANGEAHTVVHFFEEGAVCCRSPRLPFQEFTLRSRGWSGLVRPNHLDVPRGVLRSGQRVGGPGGGQW